jgi:hypothetical protein
MTTIALCLLAFCITLWAGKKSLGLGLAAVLAFGYFYGIIRANIIQTFSHFLFDAAVAGLYLSQTWKNIGNPNRTSSLKTWALLLTLWPALLVLLPTQPLLISLVGLRGAVFFLPMMWLGTKLTSRDLQYVSVAFAALNLAAMGFAVAEYFLGVPRFYPVSAVTIMIYASMDVAGGFYRIPATFVSAHNFGGVMVASIPYLLGAWEQSRHRLVRIFMLLGTAAAILGVLMSATRLNFVLGAILVCLSIWNGNMKTSRRVMFALLILGMIVMAFHNERLQRFKSLSDSDYVQDRISGSVNRGFFEILGNYPLGNGLGGGGTSIPYFLEGEVRNPIATENEYLRILCEQGVIGLLLWMGFVVWYLSRYKTAFANGSWSTTRRMVWLLSAIGLLTSVIGNGMLTSIPGTAILLLGIGFSSCAVAAEPVAARRVRVLPMMSPLARYRTVPSV